MTSPRVEYQLAGSSVSGFGSHVEELQAFFRTRGVQFGSATDLKPFVERLDADAGFRDEMASMMRTIIYRERDGLSWPELIELLAAAVGGEEADHETTPEVREALRRLMSFVESVFRTRLNPGSTASPPQVAGSERELHEPELVEAPAAHGMTDLFYRAQMTAHGGVAETIAEERRVEAADDVEDVESPLLISEPLPELGEETEGPPQRTSRFWIGAAVVCALVLAFCAGLTVHQHMLVTLRDPSQPYEQAPPEAGATATQPGTTTGVPSGPAQPPGAARMPERGMMGTHAVGAGAGAAASSAGDANVQPPHMAPGMIGASPALMASYLRYAPPLEYPMVAKMAHIQGRVMVEALVGKNGRVIRARAISGHHLLRGAAVREVYGRRYRPYTLDERPRAVATIVTVDFRLK